MQTNEIFVESDEPISDAKQTRFFTALLSSPTIAEAAQTAEISVTTAWRIMRLPSFQQEFRALRRELVERALSELQSAAGEAVAALRRNLNCGNPSAEIRAAQIILEQSHKGVELIDLAARVENLQKMLEEREKWH